MLPLVIERVRALFCVLMLLLLPCVSFAAEPEQAKAMAEAAADYLRQNGAEAAFPAINDRHGRFRDGDLYVFVHDTAGLVVAHGGYATLIGKNTRDLTDVDGKEFVKEMLAVEDTGWVDYKWQNPVTRSLDQKAVYVVRVGNYIVCAGAYKKLPATSASGTK